MSMRYAAILAAIGIAMPASGQTARPWLDYTKAAAIRDACMTYAQNGKFDIAIAIFDDSGRLVTFARTDGAGEGVATLAQWKGKSAADYHRSTEETAKWNPPGIPGIATMPGGVPIFTQDGKPLGGIGVSGVRAMGGDVACAEAGLAAAGLKSTGG